MTKQDYELIATAIWRAGFIKDKNKIRQEAKEDLKRLIVINLAVELKKDNPSFDNLKFSIACGYSGDITK